jgi:general secretion pathway protein M
MKLWFAKSQQAANAFWLMRDARERKLLSLATVVIVTTIFYLLLIAPALGGRERLNKALPLLHEQVAQMQALSSAASSLTSKTAAPVSIMTKEMLTAALSAHGLKASSVSMMNEAAQLHLQAVSFAQTLAYLDDLQKSARISVSEAKITVLAQPDQVDASFTLHQSGQP